MLFSILPSCAGPTDAFSMTDVHSITFAFSASFSLRAALSLHYYFTPLSNRSEHCWGNRLSPTKIESLCEFRLTKFQYRCHWTLTVFMNSTDWLAFIGRTFNSDFVPRVLNFFLDDPLNCLRVFNIRHLYLMNQRWLNNEVIVQKKIQ
jgi:hypothetical protein